jgi:hypothetical protein
VTGDKLGNASHVLCDCRQYDLELCSARAAKAQSAKPQNAHEMREQHLDLLAITARLREGFRFGQRAGDITETEPGAISPN